MCAGLLAAEGAYVGDLAGDPDASTLNATQSALMRAFSAEWEKRVRACSIATTAREVRGRIRRLSERLVRDTTVSPAVDDDAFITVSPTGSTAYEGRDFTPVCMNGSPYHYFAKRGRVNKLVVYYQGGGACFEQLTCSVPTCDSNVNPTGSDNPNNVDTGFADLANPANPFRDWHIVFVSYCSCDIHFGDITQHYPRTVEHRGFQNAKVVEKWAREHFVNPETVFVTGSSAGAYGAWFHAPLLHDVWPASRFHVLADAGNGVITQEFLEEFFPNWNFEANLPADIPEIQEVLENGSGIPGYTEVVADLFPDTNWAHYTTAYDGGAGGQTGFYNLMLNGNNPLAALTWWEGSCAFNETMRQQAIDTAIAIPSNYRYYIGTGARHTMYGSDKVYNDTTGGVPTIVDWIQAMLASQPGEPNPDWTNVECTNCGLTLANDPAPNPLQPPFERVGNDVVIDCAGSPSGAFIEAAADLLR
jgi:hypothetical protein